MVERNPVPLQDRDLLGEFTTAFKDADSLTVLDIYAASEQPIEGISGEILARNVSEKSGQIALYASSFADAIEDVSDSVRDGDMVLTLGAGSVSQLGQKATSGVNRSGLKSGFASSQRLQAHVTAYRAYVEATSARCPASRGGR